MMGSVSAVELEIAAEESPCLLLMAELLLLAIEAIQATSVVWPAPFPKAGIFPL